MPDAFHALEETVTRDVTRALAEDVGTGDLTARLVPAERQASARLMTREDGVLCGTEWFDRTFEELDPDVEIFWHHGDGDDILAGTSLCELEGNARALLTAERLRLAQKYAVRVGGGTNHRIGLHDGVLIKENHIVAAGGLASALREALHDASPGVMVEIEVETIAQLREALDAGARLLLLDNFDLARMREAVGIAGERAELEASGGVSLESVRSIAETGVHRISVGSLTKDVKALDLSMRFMHH